MIIWLTGQSGSGKTTLANALQKEWPCIILDGNEMRKSISLGAGFSRANRTEHNLRVARLAKVLSKQSNVVVAVIAPIKHVREQISMMMPEVKWIWLHRDVPKREGYFYEASSDYPLINNNWPLTETLKQLKKYLGIEKKKYSLFIGRYQPLHEGHLTLFEKVLAEGRNVCVAIRDTQIDENNPYSITERKQMLARKAPYARVIVIPDIEEIVHGRKVGWGVREIRLVKMVEAISATAIREGKPNE